MSLEAASDAAQRTIANKAEAAAADDLEDPLKIGCAFRVLAQGHIRRPLSSFGSGCACCTRLLSFAWAVPQTRQQACFRIEEGSAFSFRVGERAPDKMSSVLCAVWLQFQSQPIGVITEREDAQPPQQQKQEQEHAAIDTGPWHWPEASGLVVRFRASVVFVELEFSQAQSAVCFAAGPQPEPPYVNLMSAVRGSARREGWVRAEESENGSRQFFEP